MTVIEFFDNNSIDNIISVLICEPEKVILVGDNRKKIDKAIETYNAVAASRDIKVEFSKKIVNRNNLLNIVDALTSIIEENGVCTFDLAGGEDLYLVAVGIVFQLDREHVQLHRFNVRNGQLSDCDADGNLISSHHIQLSIEENVAIYGGKLLYDDEKANTTFRWTFDGDFVADVTKMWEICKADSRLWNTQINTLDALSRPSDEQTLTVSIDKEEARERAKHLKVKVIFISGLFKALERQGLITDLYIDDVTLSFAYKNAQIKRCLTKAGQLLELYVTVMAMRCTEKDGSPVYHDVMSGVVLDWDGLLVCDAPNVENEIDVMLMKGFIPVFISCKNGDMDISELYKLDTVAERFGGKYAQKVLVVPELDKMGEKGEYISARAAELDIRIIDDIDTATEEKMLKALKSLWCN